MSLKPVTLAESAARRLAGVADTLSDIADTVNAVCTRQMPPKGENFDFVVEHIARTTCGSETRIRAMLGVHCRCVTFQRRICAASE